MVTMVGIVHAFQAAFLFIFILSFPKKFSAATKTEATRGFATRLYHRDSPHSPFYNPNISAYDRETQAVQRSISRLHYFQAIKSSAASPNAAIEAPLSPGTGEYIMKLSIGTPPLQMIGTVDTGSPISWTQCLPCKECFQQQVPIFDPSKSSTFSSMACDDPLCKAVPNSSCGGSNVCHYEYVYEDTSKTSGEFAKETFIFGQTDADVSVPSIAFGCGDDNSGSFGIDKTGIFSLGGGPLSLVTQLGSLAQGRFSYCLTPSTDNNSGSQLVFGERAVISEEAATPMIRVTGRETFYFVNLNDISVGSKRLNLPSGTFHLRPDGERGLVIDSGTPITYLHIDGFYILVDALKEVIKLVPTTPPIPLLELCYIGTPADLQGLPDLIFHFDGLDVTLKPSNTFAEVADGVLCLAMASTADLSIFGNRAQQNYNVGFDLVGLKIAFAPADCAKL